MDIDHLCCLAHARAKFKYAYDQGSPQARIFLEPKRTYEQGS